MSEALQAVLIGASFGVGALAWLRFCPARLRRLGPLLAILAGALLAEWEWSLRDPNFPGHSFETDPAHVFIPVIVATLAVYVAVMRVNQRVGSYRVAGALSALAGAAVHIAVRDVTAIAMLLHCCG